MTLQQRVEKVERQNKWLRRSVALVLALLATVFLVAQAKEKEPQDLVARSLKIKDKDGKIRASLGPSGLNLADASLKTRASLVLVPDEGGRLAVGLLLSDASGWPSVSLGVEPDGDAELALTAKGDKSHARIRADAGGAGASIWDAKANVVWQAPPKKGASK